VPETSPFPLDVGDNLEPVPVGSLVEVGLLRGYEVATGAEVALYVGYK
jgi:hypothetical protein